MIDYRDTFLFHLPNKPRMVRDAWDRHRVKITDPRFHQLMRMARTMQYGWLDALPNASCIHTHPLLLSCVRWLMPYGCWVGLINTRAAAKLRRVDVLILNVYVLLRCLLGRYRWYFSLQDNLYGWAEKLMAAAGTLRIEYDGKPPKVSRRDLGVEVRGTHRRLVSNMDWRPRLSHHPELFETLVLGVDQSLGQGVDFTGRDIDLFVYGRFDPKVWTLRCDLIEALLAQSPDPLSVRLHGFAGDLADYPLLRERLKPPIYGDELLGVCRRSRLTLTIPSTDHLEINAGMPMRVYEAAATGMTQLIYQTGALSGTRFEPGRDFVFFNGTQDLIDQVHGLLSDEPRRAAIAQSCHAVWREHYTTQQCFRDLLERLPGRDNTGAQAHPV